MRLTGPQFRQVNEAFLSAFDRDELRIFLRFAFGEILDEIVHGNSNFRMVVFDVISWAESNDILDHLIVEASQSYPNKPSLKTLATDARSWGMNATIDPSLWRDPQAIFREAFRQRWDGHYLRSLALYRTIRHESELSTTVEEEISELSRC